MKQLLLKIDKRIEKLNDRISKYTIGKLLLRLLEGIVLAVLIATVSQLFFYINDVFTKDRIIKEQISSFNIGTNSEYLSQLLNVPKYQIFHKNYDLIENFYILDGIIIRGLFKNNNLVAYFITISDEKETKLIDLGIYGDLVNDKTLGKFNYYEINGYPQSVIGFVTNGSGLGCYIEDYYFASSGNYNGFIFANLPYGLSEMTGIGYDEFLRDEEIQECGKDFYRGDNLKDGSENINVAPFAYNRKVSFPSTYGVYGNNVTQEQVFDILTNWQSLDYAKFMRE